MAEPSQKSSRSRIRLWVLIAIPMIVLIASVAVRVMFDGRSLGLMALEHVGQANGFEVCQAEDFKFSLFEGLEIQNVTIEGQQAGGDLSGTIDRLVLAHQLRPLLSGIVQIDEILIDGPSFELVTRPAGSSVSGSGASSSGNASESTPVADPVGEPASGLTLAIDSIVVREANFRTYDASLPAEDTEIQGFDLELRDVAIEPGTAPAIERLVATGEMRADTMRSGETVASEAVGQLQMEDGEFRLVDFELHLPQGMITTNVVADMTRNPFQYSMKLAGTPLHTHTFIGLEEPFGLGSSQLVFEGGGLGPSPSDFRGGGRLEIGDGLLPPLPFLVEVDRILGGQSLVGAAYEAFPVAFDVEATRVTLDGLKIEVGSYGMKFEGWADAEGPLGLQLSLLAPQDGLDIKEIPREVFDAFQQADGRILIPIQIAGTSLAPEVKIDPQMIKSAAQGFVRQEVEKEVGKLLSGLFGSKDDS